MRTLFTVTVVTLLAASSASARTYYVSPTGDDTHSGSARQPLQTIQRAADVAGPGDVVIVRAGAYVGFDLESKWASAARPIVFFGEPGAKIDRPGKIPSQPPLNTASDTYHWTKWPHAITIQRSSYITIEGFELVGMPDRESDAAGTLLHKGGAGIYAGASHHLVFRRNNSHDNGRWGIFTSFCDDVLVEDNITANSHSEHGIYLSNSSDRGIIRRNRVFGNVASGIQINADNSFDDLDYRTFADPDGVSSFNVIEDNVIYDNGKEAASAINLDGVSDSIIRRNTLYNNHASGIALFQIDGRTGAQRNLVADNWIAMAADSRWAIELLGCQLDNLTDAGRCAGGDVPRLPEWHRPHAEVSGSTGNRIVNNLIWNDSLVTGGIYVDKISLAADAVSGKTTVSERNMVVDRFAINSDLKAYDPVIMDAAAWRKATGLDQTSVVLPANK